MKWKNSGHEFDQLYQEIEAAYLGRKIVIYGAGMMGGRTYDAITKLSELSVAAFFDQDLQKETYKGLPVYHTGEKKEFLDKNRDVVIVIGLPDDVGVRVKEEFISEYGVEESNCKLYSEFMMHDFPVFALYRYNKVFLDTVSMIVTESCTLKCEKCAIMLPYFKDAHVYPFDKLAGETAVLFDKTDFVGNYTLTGGEPLLYPKLCRLIQYIGENFRKQIGSFKIITNGTVLPSEELLALMRQYDMAVEISDYTAGVPSIKSRVDEVRERFGMSGISTYFLSTAEWVDFGFETVNNQYNAAQLQSFFDYCHTRCRGYVDGKLRYCINAYFAERTLHEKEDEKNAFDIVAMTSSAEERRKLVEFDLGYNGEGFLDMCQHCNGTVEINQNYIEVGKQCVNH